MFAPRLLVSPDLAPRAALVGLAPARSARPSVPSRPQCPPQSGPTDGITQRDNYRIAQLEDLGPHAPRVGVGPGRGTGISPWPVSPARPPHRTCESPRIRRSTGSRWLCGSGWDARPGGGDAGAPVEVPCDRNRLWPEHLGVAILYLPAVQKTALQRSPVQAPVPFTEPADYPPPCEVFEVAEGRRRHAVPEVAAPAPQDRVELAQQVSERLVPCSFRHRPHLADNRVQRFLRRIGVDNLPGCSLLGPPLEVKAQEVKPLVNMADPGLGPGQA